LTQAYAATVAQGTTLQAKFLVSIFPRQLTWLLPGYFFQKEERRSNYELFRKVFERKKQGSRSPTIIPLFAKD